MNKKKLEFHIITGYFWYTAAIFTLGPWLRAIRDGAKTNSDLDIYWQKVTMPILSNMGQRQMQLYEEIQEDDAEIQLP